MFEVRPLKMKPSGANEIQFQVMRILKAITFVVYAPTKQNPSYSLMFDLVNMTANQLLYYNSLFSWHFSDHIYMLLVSVFFPLNTLFVEKHKIT